MERKIIRNPFGNAPKPVIQIDFDTNEIIQRYESVSQAGSQFGKQCSRVAITNCLNGKTETAYGYKWKYE